MKKIYNNKLEVLVTIVVFITIAAVVYCYLSGDEVSVRYLNIIMNFYLAISFIYFAKHYKRPSYYFFTLMFIIMGILWICKHLSELNVL